MDYYYWSLLYSAVLSSRYAVRHTLMMCCCIDNVRLRWTHRLLTEDLKDTCLPPVSSLSLPAKLRWEEEAMGRTSVFSVFSLSLLLYHYEKYVDCGKNSKNINEIVHLHVGVECTQSLMRTEPSVWDFVTVFQRFPLSARHSGARTRGAVSTQADNLTALAVTIVMSIRTMTDLSVHGCLL